MRVRTHLKFLSPCKISDPRETMLNFRPMPNFEPTQKTYLPSPNFSRPMQPRKPMQILTHATHATCELTQPTEFSRLTPPLPIDRCHSLLCKILSGIVPRQNYQNPKNQISSIISQRKKNQCRQ